MLSYSLQSFLLPFYLGFGNLCTASEGVEFGRHPKTKGFDFSETQKQYLVEPTFNINPQSYDKPSATTHKTTTIFKSENPQEPFQAHSTSRHHILLPITKIDEESTLPVCPNAATGTGFEKYAQKSGNFDGDQYNTSGQSGPLIENTASFPLFGYRMENALFSNAEPGLVKHAQKPGNFDGDQIKNSGQRLPLIENPDHFSFFGYSMENPFFSNALNTVAQTPIHHDPTSSRVIESTPQVDMDLGMNIGSSQNTDTFPMGSSKRSRPSSFWSQGFQGTGSGNEAQASKMIKMSHPINEGDYRIPMKPVIKSSGHPSIAVPESSSSYETTLHNMAHNQPTPIDSFPGSEFSNSLIQRHNWANEYSLGLDNGHNSQPKESKSYEIFSSLHKDFTGINDILNFSPDVFSTELDENQVSAAQSHINAIHGLIYYVQPQTHELVIPTHIRNAFDQVASFSYEIRVLNRHNKSRNININKGNNLEKSERDKEFEKREKNREVVGRRKAFQVAALKELATQRSLWNWFWDVRFGIKLIDRGTLVPNSIETRLTAVLFYTSMIGTILRDHFGEKNNTSVLLRKAIRLLSRYFGMPFVEADQVKVPITEQHLDPNEPSEIEIPHVVDKQTFIWNAIAALITSLNDDKLNELFFRGSSRKISSKCQAFFNNIFYFSIQQLGVRLRACQAKYLHAGKNSSPLSFSLHDG